MPLTFRLCPSYIEIISRDLRGGLGWGGVSLGTALPVEFRCVGRPDAEPGPVPQSAALHLNMNPYGSDLE